ncbi:hydroxyisourate hydrolase [Stenotrophomonas sp. C3(2023)]|uniref:hydroxyisourate hydrolase n=1 Tax=Stenotrophomonas sp. C3(2023) TaxID=3080277 RepID=UPI00293C6D19|nr:hydroxyisourate hydrolase [Stenotrophomonas sp. C3(2023)]MDV3467965.1 hydroxyisourate hydrolase [Stenotrophomonas sp. C3(2023)]
MSVHVLDMQTGLPSVGVEVELERRQPGGRWERIGSGVTNHDGRIEALYPQTQPLEQGEYRVTFQTGAWYQQQHVDAFYPVVQLVLRVDGRLPHYHVPLLLSPFGYTTYRGS